MIVRTSVRVGLAAALTLGLAATACVPAQAADGGAIAAGVIGGAALGALATGALARPVPPPPPPAYYEPAPAYYAPPPPPRHCWREPRQVWDGYGYVERPVRVCE